MTEELTEKSATELGALIRTRRASAVEVVAAHLKKLEQVNAALNAIVTIAPDALDLARAIDNQPAGSHDLPTLRGVPITVKDTIDTEGLRTTCGSRLRVNYIPEKDATVVARLKAAGAIIIGKTNTPEMAIPYETDNPVFGRTNNPFDLKRTPGGSSGGEAAAIAARSSPAGIGSDLSGSIRVPAHFCGIAGLKPTTGLLPMDGHVPPPVSTMSLGACVGPMARRVNDLALLLKVLADAPPRVDTESDFIEQSRRQLRGVGLAHYSDNGVAPVTDEIAFAVELAAKALAEAGLQVRAERPPAVSEGSRLWIELFARAAQQQLCEFYRGREDEAGPRVAHIIQRHIQEPTFANKIERAEKAARSVVERERLREILLSWMKSTPLILAPVGSVPAFPHGAERVQVKGKSLSVFRAFSYSQTFNVFGLPAVSVPVTRSAEGLPIGVQIVGRPFEEETVLAAAAIVEQAFSGVS